MTRHKPFRLKVNAIPQLWRPLPREWNARDFEYEAGRSKLLHFTILHTQPWQPFPKQLKYQTHALADLWCALERAADESRFTMFTKAQPSSRFRQAQAARKAGKSGEDLSEKEPSWQSGLSEALVRQRKVIDGLIGQTEARSLLLCDSGHNGSSRKAADREADKQELGPLFANLELSWDDPLSKDSLGETTFDGVVATAPMTWCPDDDVPWVLDAMFTRARRFVFMVADWGGVARARGGGEMPWLVQDPDWWRSEMACAARRHRGVRWTLCVSHRTWLGTRTNVFTEEI